MQTVRCKHCGKEMQTRSISGQTRCCGCHKLLIFDQKKWSQYVKESDTRHPEWRKNYTKKYRRKHPERVALTSHKLYVKKKAAAKAQIYAVHGAKCKVCGESCEPCLVVHHKSGKNGMRKELVALCSLYRYQIYATQLNDIIVLCQNCHHKLHAGLIKIDWD